MAAYNEGELWLTALNDYVLANHEYVRDTLQSAFSEIIYQVPDSTYLAWIDLSPLNLDMKALEKTLIETFHVAIMPGSTYGKAGKNHMRLNLGCPRSKVEVGVDALIQAIKRQR